MRQVQTKIERVGVLWFVDYEAAPRCWKNYSSHRDYGEAVREREQLRARLANPPSPEAKAKWARENFPYLFQESET